MNKYLLLAFGWIVILTMQGYGQEKKHGINLAIDVLEGWDKNEISLTENEILLLADVDALRVIAFASRSAAYPENAENVARDEKLNKLFWASVKALSRISTDDSKGALVIIRNSGLVKGGDKAIFDNLITGGQTNSGDP